MSGGGIVPGPSGGGGGGATLPDDPAAVLLDAGAPSRFVALDGSGVGTSWTGAQAQAILTPAVPVSLASATGWSTRNGEGGSGTSAVNTGTQSLDLACTSAGSQVYTTIGRAPPASPPIFDVRSRLSAFSSAASGDGMLMFMCDALAASITLGVSISGTDVCSAFSSSGNPGASVTVAGAGDGQGWLRLVVIAGLQAAAYVGIGAAGEEPTSWTCVGYVQLAAGGRIVWPFIAWQMNRNSGSGNVTATVTSIRYVTAT